jgi:hypothetical protein
MSGFLTTIAARSVAATAPSAVRPRPLSLFEPVRHESDLEEQEAAPEPAQREPQPARNGDRPPVTVHAHDEPGPVVEGTGECDPPPGPPVRRPEAALVTPPREENDGPAPETAATEVVTAATSARVLVRTELAEAPVQVEPRAELRGLRATSPRGEEGHLDRSPEPSRLVSTVPRAQVLRLESRGERSAPHAVSRRPVLAAPPSPRRATDPLLTLRAEAASPERDVHVTIGRVEIRAIQERAPRQPERPAKPSAMSLDSYLRGRAREGAR